MVGCMLLFRIVFHDVHDFSHTMEVQLQIFFNISFFLCSTGETHAGLEQLEGE